MIQSVQCDQSARCLQKTSPFNEFEFVYLIDFFLIGDTNAALFCIVSGLRKRSSNCRRSSQFRLQCESIPTLAAVAELLLYGETFDIEARTKAHW